MGGLAEKMVIDAMDALAAADRARPSGRSDGSAAGHAAARGRGAGGPDDCAPPAGGDRLREIIGAIRVAGDLERVGDLAKNIAKRSVKIGLEFRVPRAIVGIKHMNDFALELMKDVLDAYAQRATSSGRSTSGSGTPISTPSKIWFSAIS